jgi:hypothetical protein
LLVGIILISLDSGFLHHLLDALSLEHTLLFFV